MTGNQICQSFLQFSADHGHRVVPGSSLRLRDTPTPCSRILPWHRSMMFWGEGKASLNVHRHSAKMHARQRQAQRRGLQLWPLRGCSRRERRAWGSTILLGGPWPVDLAPIAFVEHARDIARWSMTGRRYVGRAGRSIASDGEEIGNDLRRDTKLIQISKRRGKSDKAFKNFAHTGRRAG
jgi:hypothetical protein